jgi:hypothetical protein
VPGALSVALAPATRQALAEAMRAEQLLRAQDGTVSDVWLNSLAKVCFIQVSSALRPLSPCFTVFRQLAAAVHVHRVPISDCCTQEQCSVRTGQSCACMLAPCHGRQACAL